VKNILGQPNLAVPRVDKALSVHLLCLSNTTVTITMSFIYLKPDEIMSLDAALGTAWRLVCVIAALYSIYILGLVVCRLTFHPLAKIPGPLLCRVSYLPQAYYEAVLQGKFIHEIPKYHEKYGMSHFKRAIN